MDENHKNLFCDQQSITMNYSQSHYYNSFSVTTNESSDFSTEISAVQLTTQHQDHSATSHGNMMNTSRNFATFNLANQVETHNMRHILPSYLKFYHFYINFYLVICKIILKEESSDDDHDHYNHEFFY